MNASHSRICEAGVVQQHDPLLHRFMLIWFPPRSSIQQMGRGGSMLFGPFCLLFHGIWTNCCTLETSSIQSCSCCSVVHVNVVRLFVNYLIVSSRRPFRSLSCFIDETFIFIRIYSLPCQNIVQISCLKSNFVNFDQVFRKGYQHLQYQINIMRFIKKYIFISSILGIANVHMFL